MFACGTVEDQQKRRSKVLSEYYNLPGRLAIFRRKFDNVNRRDGEDPASFATELEILAVRGFGDVGQKAWTQIDRDRSSWDNETVDYVATWISRRL